MQKPVIGFRAYPEKLPRNFPRGVLVVDVPERSVLESAGLRGTSESRLGDIIGRKLRELADSLSEEV